MPIVPTRDARDDARPVAPASPRARRTLVSRAANALPRTLFGKLLIVLLAFGAMMMVILALIIELSHQNYHLELDQRASSTLAARILAQGVADGGGAGALAALQDTHLGRLAAVNTGVDLYVLDARGKVLASSVPRTGIRRDHVEMAAVRRFLRGDDLPILGIDPGDMSRRDVFSVASISGRGSDETFLYALLHRREHQTGAGLIRASYLLGEGAWVVVTGTLFALASSLLMVRLVTRRLDRLAGAMERFRRSGFARPPDTQGDSAGQPDDEVGRISRTFAEMAQRIVEQMQDLKRMDALRQEMLTDVSGALGAPLTALHGSLETLTLSAATLSLDDRREGLEVATRQARRMTKLLTKVLELAKLETHQISAKQETFALTDVAREVAQKYDLAASRKEVHLRTDVADHLPLALGDDALIERVLDNLLEIALHRAAPGGTVGLRLLAAKAAIAVEVFDARSGTVPKDASQLSDRFDGVASPNGLGRDELGLAIAKNILDLHGARLHVSARAEGGTTFRFALAARTAGRDDVGVWGRDLTGPVRLRPRKT